MFRHLNLPQKVALGFGLVIGLVMVISVINLAGLRKVFNSANYIVEDRIPVADMTMEAQIAVLKARDAMGEFLNHEEGFNEIAAEFREYMTEARQILTEEQSLTQAEKAATEQVLDLLDSFERDALRMQQAHRQAVAFKRQAGELMEIMDAAGEKLLETAQKVGLSFAEYDIINEMLMAVNDFLITGADEEIENFKRAAQKITNLPHFQAIERPYQEVLTKAQATISAYQNYFKAQKEARAAMKALDATSEKVLKAMEELEENVYGQIEALKMSAKGKYVKILWGTLALLLIIIGMSSFTGLTIVKEMKKKLSDLVSSIKEKLDTAQVKLQDSLSQVVSAASIVSSSSQQLAEGTSEQAASLEETSASMEEITSMAKRNADNAIQTDQLMKETQQIVNRTETSMKELTNAMENMVKVSERVQKIVKSIDEIAFQTNLLALNAAVEAARAGEAGQGFAVVADEVRNLAQRTATAAKDTAELIEQTVRGIHTNLNLVKKVDIDFVQVEKHANKVASLIAEITVASQEQTQGITQINTALTQLDKAIQEVAANSEELSSASQELNAQAETMQYVFKETMKGILEKLHTLLGRSSTQTVAFNPMSQNIPSPHVLLEPGKG